MASDCKCSLPSPINIDEPNSKLILVSIGKDESTSSKLSFNVKLPSKLGRGPEAQGEKSKPHQN